MKKFLAFTLAETLVVIGIIGVVSALTLPNLNSATGEKEKVAKVKKVYKDVKEAYDRAIVVYGSENKWYQASDNTLALKSKRFGERMSEFMKVSKDCGMATGLGCFSSSNWSGFNSDRSYSSLDLSSNSYKLILAD